MHIRQLQVRKISHVGQFVVDLAVQKGALVAGERGLQALLDESAD